jgi:diguanylate cyclase (GGDEF)-like protein/PAS domain S-box-containing protein
VKRFFSVQFWLSARHSAPVHTVAAVGIAASLAVWYLAFSAEQRATVQEFNARANNQAITMDNGIDDYWDELYAVQALIESLNQKITREQFGSFAKALVSRHTGMLNIAWAPRVARDQRAAYELAANRDGFTDYHIRAIAADGSLVVSPERDEYFPKYYSTDAITSPAYGIDLSDGTQQKDTVEHIRDADVLSATAPLLLHTGEGDRRGFWAGIPIYARGLPHETVEERRRNVLGIVQGVFQIQVMFDTILGNIKAPVRLYLFSADAAANDLPIYYSSRLGSGSIEAQTQLTAGLHRTFAMHLGDVKWTLVVTPEVPDLLLGGHKSSTIVLICGLLLSAALTSSIWGMRRRARTIEMANKKIETQNIRFHAALNNMAQGLVMYDRDGKLAVTNRRFAEIYGVPWEKWEIPALGTNITQTMQLRDDLSHNITKNRTEILTAVKEVMDHHTQGNVIAERADGQAIRCSFAATDDGGLVGTFEDITESRRIEERISHLARHDALTDLPNRVHFYEKMEALLGSEPQKASFAVFSLDLDHFKNVNDTLGHPIGDKLLQMAAARMRSCVRDRDIVARLGGDEFAVLQVKFDRIADVAALATRLIDKVGAPYRIDDLQVMVGTSIGIAIAPSDGTQPGQLVKNADLALYRCKADGGGVYRFFEAQMDARMQERRTLELDLRMAVAKSEFTLNYQPIVNIKTGKINACEALIRWHHDERGQVSPVDFIPIAEETGLIVPIGEWVLRRACADAADWPDGIAVSVNVSPAQLKSANFVQVVEDALAESRFPAERLELEITELVLMRDNNATLAQLRRLKELGVKIVMDDFGTGYSSLGYLRSFPFDRIKIDQSFVRDAPTDKESLAIVRAVVGLGRGLSIGTTAEGVETLHQLEVLRSEGCTDAQGFFFSRPQTASDVKFLLTSLDDSPAKAIA